MSGLLYPSAEVLATAVRHARDGDYPDHNDASRMTREEQEIHNFRSKASEGVFSAWLESQCIPHDWDAIEDDPTDVDVSAYGVGIDVKMRQPWTAPGGDADLLITTSRVTPDIYFQLDIHPDRDRFGFSLVGWITHDEAKRVWRNADFAPTADKYVPRRHLKSPSSLLDGLVQMKNTAQDGQTASPQV